MAFFFFTQSHDAPFSSERVEAPPTSTARLLLIGHCLALAEVERLDVRLPKRGKIRLSDVVKSYVGLLTLGKSDFEAIEAFRWEQFFRETLGIGKVPGSVWLRQ